MDAVCISQRNTQSDRSKNLAEPTSLLDRFQRETLEIASFFEPLMSSDVIPEAVPDQPAQVLPSSGRQPFAFSEKR